MFRLYDPGRWSGRKELNDLGEQCGAAFHVAGSLGVTYQFGTTNELTILGASGVTLVRTRLKVSTFGILYSISYVF